MSRDKITLPPKFHAVLWTAAVHDYRTAEYLAANPEMTTNNVGMHLQQSVEKALKALLSKRKVTYKFTHDLTKLFKLAASKSDVPAEFDDLQLLTPFVEGLRYELPVPADDFNSRYFVGLTREFLDWISAEGDFSLS